LQACRKTVAPSSSVCSLSSIAAALRASSLANFALWSLNGKPALLAFGGDETKNEVGIIC